MGGATNVLVVCVRDGDKLEFLLQRCRKRSACFPSTERRQLNHIDGLHYIEISISAAMRKVQRRFCIAINEDQCELIGTCDVDENSCNIVLVRLRGDQKPHGWHIWLSFDRLKELIGESGPLSDQADVIEMLAECHNDRFVVVDDDDTTDPDLSCSGTLPEGEEYLPGPRTGCRGIPESPHHRPDPFDKIERIADGVEQ